jgi:hypothetical protein
MRRSKLFVAFLFAAVFLLGAVVYTVTGTYAREGKVIPPDWCLEHGSIRAQDTDDPYVCIYCE